MPEGNCTLWGQGGPGKVQNRGPFPIIAVSHERKTALSVCTVSQLMFLSYYVPLVTTGAWIPRLEFRETCIITQIFFIQLIAGKLALFRPSIPSSVEWFDML